MRKIFQSFHYWFVPGEENGHRARVIHHDFLTYYLLLAFAFVVFTKHFDTNITQVLGFATDITVENLLKFTNKERAEKNLPPLTYNETLSHAAQEKARDMFAKNYWSHYSPDGKAPWDFITTAGYQYDIAGENLAKNFLFSKNVVDAWVASPTHRDNLLRAEYTNVGFAIVNGMLNGEQTTLVVQMFGKPQNGVIVRNTEGLEELTEGSMLAKKINPLPSATTSPPLALIYIFLGFLIAAFSVDLYVANKLHIVRFHGKSLAHLMFLSAVLLGLFFFLSKGLIL